MKSFPSNFIAEKDKPAGASPVWVLKCPFASGTIYISDQTFTITGWDGGPTTLAWVRDWGSIEEDISGVLGTPLVASMDLRLINDPDDASNIEAILDDAANSIETTDCELYLWFTDLDASTDPPQLMWTGNVVDWVKEDELEYSLELVDESVRVNKYVGSKISAATYPNADKDDVGKLGNILYGVVKKVPARAVVAGGLDYLDAAITGAQTTLTLVDAAAFPASGTVGLEEEEISYTGKTGNQLTGLTRAANGTTAATHARGSVVWEVRSDFTYEAASHPIKQFDAIYADGHNTRLKITSVCTLYTGQTGDEHPTWGGRAMVVVPSKMTKAQAVDLLVQDGITVNDAITVVDTIAVSDTITVDDLLTVSDNIGVSNPAHNHGTIEQSITQYPTTPALPTQCTNSGSWTFPAVSGTVIDTVYNVEVGSGFTTFQVYGVAMSLNASNIFTKTGSGSAPTSVPWSGASSGTQVKVLSRTVRYTATINNATQNTTKTGSASRGGSVSKGGMATKTGAASKSGAATKSGTVTMTGNSVADTVVADKVLVDAQGYQDDASGSISGTPSLLLERPDHVMKHFLVTYGGWPVADWSSAAASSAFSSNGYKFSVVINEHKKLKEWLNYMAWQCRCWFRFYAGKAYLLYRPDSLSSLKTITSSMVRMNDDATSTTRVMRSPLGEVINKIAVHYSRDWPGSGYQLMTEASDATSIAKYGEKEHPDLFEFDFIEDTTMAQSLRDFYITRYKDRRKVVEFEVFLDNIELEFADAVTLGAPSLLGEVQAVNVRPGSGRENRNDAISLKVREY